MSLNSESTVTTVAPARNLGRLCKHLAHRCKVNAEAERAQVEFPGGATCEMHVNGAQLHMVIQAPNAETLARVQEVLSRHLLQVASGEALDISWSESTLRAQQ